MDEWLSRPSVGRRPDLYSRKSTEKGLGLGETNQQILTRNRKKDVIIIMVTMSYSGIDRDGSKATGGCKMVIEKRIT